ncbi:MAG: MarR family transcriptional regulator [Actinobacteria bacterium ATB1]|nr:MarR family transcriptional regulator [Actinobacteria bacterium ATB1]
MDETRWVDDFAVAWAREYPDAEDTSGLILISLLARLSLQIEGFQAAVLRPFDLNPSDYAVLAALRRAGPPYRMAPNELYTLLERSSGGMTKMLKRLEGLGLVERVEDPDDKRSKLVRLTSAGIAAEEEAFEAFLASTHELLRSTSAKELEQIDEALRRLVVIIESNPVR